MAKRISKKLMVGLGSTLTFGTVGLVGGFGVKALNDLRLSNDWENQLNRATRLGYNDIPITNTPSSDMFNLPKLTTVSLGNIQKGQTVTPYGWLNRLTDQHSRLVLTGWNGEIIWTTPNFHNSHQGRIYDAKYDWNTDTILVLRYAHNNGGFWVPGSNARAWLYFEILDAKTGNVIKSVHPDPGQQDGVYNIIKNQFIDVTNNSPRFNELYNLDSTSWENDNNLVLYNYLPNFMQLIEKNANDETHSLPSFKTVLENFNSLSKQILFFKNYDNTGRPDIITLQFNNLINQSSQINTTNDQWTFNGSTERLSDFAILINPFVTPLRTSGEFLIHFIVANKSGKILHKTFGFKIDRTNQTFLPAFDKTELVPDTIMKVMPNRWSNAKQWTPNFVEANLRVNRNMFNQNSVVAAYPYAANNQSSNNYPIFNVVQLLINPTTGLIDTSTTSTNFLRTTNFDFGKQIYDFWDANKNSSSVHRRFNPWPLSEGSWNATNTNHNYNRLVSVSPFDNTIIYAANPNSNYLTITTHEDHKVNWANFWIATNNNPSGKGQYHPMLIPNEPDLGGSIDGDMISMPNGQARLDNIYKNGFIFDLGSLIANGNQRSLNVYFNSNPSSWWIYGGVSRTVKIGLLEDVLKKDTTNKFWFNSVTTQINDDITGFNAPIRKSDFSTLIHSRADLEKWYPRTWQNANVAANKYSVGQQINANENSNKRVVAKSYSKLNDPNLNSIESVDLVTHWTDPTLNSNNPPTPPNYNRLAVKRPKITVKEAAKYDPADNKKLLLPVEIAWKPNSTIINKYKTIFNVSSDSDVKIQRLILTKTQTLTNVSQEIDRQWSVDGKMTQFSGTTENLIAQADFNINSNRPFDVLENLRANGIRVDSKLNPNFRLLLQIQKPTSPNWTFGSAENYFFEKYPVEPKVGEISFQSVLTKFIEWKVRNLKFRSITRNDDPLQNITINAFIGLSSTYEGTEKTIYKEAEKEIIQVDETTNQLLLYQDVFKGNRKVYTQEATTFDDAKNWGWGAKGQQAVTSSWKSGSIPSSTTKFLMKFNPTSFFNDNLVRLDASSNQQQPLFKAKYDVNNNQNLEIIPLNSNEFNNRFKFFNQLGFIVKFEYLDYGDNQNNWKDLGNRLTDKEIINQLTSNQKLVFANVSSNIDKIRFRLLSHTSDANSFIDFGTYFDQNNSKFISDQYKVDPKTITINPNWFKEVELSAADNWANSLNEANFETYENKVFAKSQQLDQEKTKFKFQYKLETDRNWSERSDFVSALSQRFAQSPTTSILSLWNETAGNGTKIKVRIIKKDVADTSVEIVGPNGSTNQIPEGYVKTDNLNTKVDLSQYINVLVSQKTTANQIPNQEGKISSFSPPSLPGEKNSFDKLATILNSVGISYQYKKWDFESNPSNPNWSNWLDNRADVNSYNLTKPEIKLGFKTNLDFRVKLFNGQTQIDGNSEFILALDLPKIVKINNTIIENFKNSNPLTGNTFQLSFDQTKERDFINKIIEHNNSIIGKNSHDFDDLANQLEITYALANEPKFYTAEALKQELASRNQDQTNNKISFKLNLKNSSTSDFKLDSLSSAQHNLLDDGNSVVKKYVHGRELEQELNGITVTQFPEVNNAGQTIFRLNYTYPTNIKKLVDGQWKDLRLEYSFKDLNVATGIGNDPEAAWVNDNLPTEFNPKYKKIYIRVGVEDGNNTEYVYGPKENQSRQKGVIDLTKLKVPIKVNSQWFKDTKLNPTSSPIVLSDILNNQIFAAYEKEIFKKIKGANPNLTDEDLNKLEIKFNFNKKTGLNITGLIAELEKFQKDYSSNHLGILQLWDGVDSSSNAQKIQAIFSTKNPSEDKINFIDTVGNPNQNLTGDINTSGINTEVDLRNYINVLETEQTAVQIKNGQAGTVQSFTPPAMSRTTSTTFLSGKTYQEIETRLSQIGIRIVFKQVGTGSEAWVEKNQVQKYDPTKGILHLAFENKANNNIILDLGKTVSQPGTNTYNNPVVLRLNAPKQITITRTNVDGFINDSSITGNTKYLEITNALPKVQKLIDEIKKANQAASNNNAFLSAPIKIVFSLGGGPFVDLNTLKTELEKQTNTTDLTNNRLVFKFVIDGQNNNEWIINADQTEYEIYPSQIDANAAIKIYVNDNGLWNSFKTGISFSGSNKQLRWIWPDGDGTKVDVNNNIIKAPGVGLKVQFTFNANADIDDQNIVTDPKVGWTNDRPSAFDLTQKNVWIRIVPLSGYVYEKGTKPGTTNEKIVLDLSKVKQEITIDSNWLNQSFTVAAQYIDKISVADIDKYEQLVKGQMIQSGLDVTTINTKLTFEYEFNGEKLTKNSLVQKIQTYKNTTNNNDFGFLKLSNGKANSGKEIKAKIVKANPGDNGYELAYQNGENHLLDTANIKTKIELTNLINWLKTIKAAIKEGTADNSIAAIMIPNVATTDNFNQKTWDAVDKGLKALGVNVQYRNYLNTTIGAEDNWGPITSVNQYNPNIGQFQIRFEIDGTIGTNLELNISNQTFNQANPKSDPVNVKLAVKKKFQINEQFVQDFINAPDLIEANANTKNLKIKSDLEQKMITEIKKANAALNPDFASADLIVEYQMAKSANLNENNWLTLDDFLNSLKNSTTDKSTNEINFRFRINPNNPTSLDEFSVDEKARVLSAHQAPAANIKIAYYINTSNLETLANNISVRGTTQNLTWDFNGLNIQEANNQTFINLAAGQGLRVEFTTKSNPNYNDPVGSDSTDITTGWTTIKPSQIAAETKQLHIRLIEQPGFVYQAKAESKATVHKVNTDNLKILIQVNQEWIKSVNLTVAAAGQFINQIELSDITKYQNDVLQNISDNDLRSEVEIRFSFRSETNLTAQQLFEKIKNILENNLNPDFGVFQIKNEQIKARFVLKNPNSKYQLINQNNSENPTDLEGLVNTDRIKVLIDLQEIVNFLKKQKLKVQLLNRANNNRSLVNIQQVFPPERTPVSQDQTTNKPKPLSNLEWNLFESRLSSLGIILEARAVVSAGQSNQNWTSISNIKVYDDTINKIEVHFKLNPAVATNIVLSVNQAQDVDSSKPESTSFQVSLKAPARIVIDQQYVTEFINGNPISGNTKFLTIDQAKEEQLIAKIIQANVNNNQIFNEAKGRLKVEYQLGDGTANNWKQRQAFIDNLKAQSTNQTTNQISMRFIVENDANDENQQIFQVDNNPKNVVQAQIGVKDAKVKIYINENGLEQLIAKTKLVGTNNNFAYQWANGFSVDQTTGIINQIPGLRIQYTKKQSQPNQAYDSSLSYDNPDNGWANAQVNSIDPVTRFLALQIVATDGYIYGPQNKQTDNNDQSPNWTVHQVNTDQIKSEIKLAVEKGLKEIVFKGQVVDSINFDEIKNQLEAKAKSAAEFVDSSLQAFVGLEYQLVIGSNPNPNQWLTIDGLKAEMQKYVQAYDNETLAIMKFGLAQNSFFSIKARFISNNENYIVLNKNAATNTDQIQSALNGYQVQTDGLITLVDLSNYVDVLTNTEVILGSGSSTNSINGMLPPAMTGTSGAGFLFGQDFNKIKSALNKVGIVVEFNAPDGSTGSAWVEDPNQITSLNRQNDLFIRFRIKMDNFSTAADKEKWAKTFLIKTNNNDSGVLEQSKDYATTAIKLKVNLPIIINVDATTNLTGFIFKGTTLTINNKSEIKSRVDQIIAKVFNDNSSSGTTLDPQQVPLKIMFSLNSLDLDNQGTWFELEDFINKLSSSKTNWNTNQILAKFELGSIAPNGQKYEIENNATITVQAEDISDNAVLKIYIHKGQFVNNIVNLAATGSTEDYDINGLDEWLKTVPQGLKVQFSNDDDANTNNNATWNDYISSSSLPKPLNSNKKLWIRFEVKPGYIYQELEAQPGQNHTQATAINTSQLKVILKLQTDWLHQIELTGNTKKIQIDEAKAIKALQDANILPTSRNDLIEFQYSIDQKRWMTKNDFIKFLEQQAGSKDETHFILRREDIMVRFNINPASDQNNEYTLNIDGQSINETNRDQYNIQLVDENHNQGLEGYININKLTDFEVDNFGIKGTTTKPIFVIKNRTNLDNLLQVYASFSDIFDIQFSAQKSGNNWVWETANTLLENGQLIASDSDYLIQKGVTIGADKFFAIRFIAKPNSNYKVYFNDNEQADGQILDISKNVHITIEITNPFVTQNKLVGLWFRNDNDTVKYYQSEGGFKLSVFDPTTNTTNKQQSAFDFIKSSGLSQQEQDALEFVYHVFDFAPTQEQIDQISNPTLINDYNNSTWTAISPEMLETGSTGFTKSLKLKVGQFVTVGIRVKQEYAQRDEGFVLKDNQHSILKPIIDDQTMPGRVNGYKVKTDLVKVDFANIKLGNLLPTNNTDLLDGFTFLKQVNLVPDAQQNYLGISLNLKLYNEFHTQNGKPIVLNGKTKLVKRNPAQATGATQYYQDATGAQIKDDNGQPIPILKDANNKLVAPTEQTNPTKQKVLLDYNNGNFGLTEFDSEIDVLSLFKNQRITLEYQAKQGLNLNNLADFELDKNDVNIELKDYISPQIKFAIDNPNNIRYQFQQENFNPENIKYKGNDPISPDQAVSGLSEVATPLSMIRMEGANNSEIISANTPAESVKLLEEKLKTDFNSQLKFETTYESVDGNKQVFDGANIYQLNKLKNGDRIVLRIVANDPDLTYLETAIPLFINVKGLVGSAPTKDKLQYLRVEQGGILEGQGSFKILVNKPGDDQIDSSILLKGWKFLIRVWNSKKEIKIPWTEEVITGLNNGDKVEWKLVDENENPVRDGYYNTVAQNHETNNGKIKYNFAQVNYPNGINSQAIINPTIGDYPKESEIYPEDSGFVISGLKDELEYFEISTPALNKLFISDLKPEYVGLNGQGAITFNKQLLDHQHYVDTNGNLMNAEQLSQSQLNGININPLETMPLEQFLDNVTFYTVDPTLNPYAIGFKFKDNETNTGNALWNDSKMWAKFDIIQSGSDRVVNSIVTELPPVTGLSNVSDPMNPLWYLLITVGGIATLGIMTIIYFVVKNKKLK